MREFYWPWKVVSHTGFLSLFCSSLTESLCSGIDCPRRSTSTGNFSTGFDPNSIVCLPGKPVVELWWWLQSLFNMMFLTSRWYRLQAEVEQEARFAFWISGAISKGNFSAKRLTSRFWMFTGLIVGEGGIVLPPKETPVHLRLKFHRTVSNKCRLICSRYYRSRTSTSFPVPQQFQCQQESKSLHHHFLRNSANSCLEAYVDGVFDHVFRSQQNQMSCRNILVGWTGIHTFRRSWSTNPNAPANTLMPTSPILPY